MSSLETFRFYGTLASETLRALLVHDGVENIWLPRSQVKSMRQIRDTDYEFVIPYWLAKKKGIL